ncbi:MAG: AMP-binding protein [Gemmatimonadota bacterium]
MSDPLSFLPLALAGANGAIDGFDCRQLVASGVALLQRAAPLVRALHGRRAAILLPASPQFLIALSASAGRSALLLDPELDSASIGAALRSANVGAVFTVGRLGSRLPVDVPQVLLDESPSRAEWRGRGDSRVIDLSLHAGLQLEGDPEVEGADEDVVSLPGSAFAPAFPSRDLRHRDLMSCARATARSGRLGPRDHALTLTSACNEFGLVVGILAPLLGGGRVSTGRREEIGALVDRVEGEGVSTIVAEPSTYAAIADALDRRARPLDAPVLQHCIAGGCTVDPALAARWLTVSPVPLVQGDVRTSDGGYSMRPPAGRDASRSPDERDA